MIFKCVEGNRKKWIDVIIIYDVHKFEEWCVLVAQLVV